MRISDWSSDVFSSDVSKNGREISKSRCQFSLFSPSVRCSIRCKQGIASQFRSTSRTRALSTAIRSEEHTSELQSLMRISYAVFCLKKKRHIQNLTSMYPPIDIYSTYKHSSSL